MDKPYVRINYCEGIAWIKFFHPKANAFSSEQLINLKKAIDQASEQECIQTIVLQSASSDIFSSGASLDELTRISNLEEGIAFFMNFSHLFISMIRSQKPILAGFSGKAIAGAVGLLAACDCVIGNSSILVRLSELSIGLAPLVIEPVIVNRIGKAHYMKLAFHPKKWQGAIWCENTGLVDHVIHPEKDLSEILKEHADFLANCDSFSIAKIKSIFYGDIHNWVRLLKKRARLSAELTLRQSAQKKILS